MPLHERLNNEMKKNKTESDEEDQHENSEEILKNDPYFINENLLKEEEESLDDTQRQVEFVCFFLFQL